MVKTVDLNEREKTEWNYLSTMMYVFLAAFLLSAAGLNSLIWLLAIVAGIIVLKMGFLNGVKYDARAAKDKFK